MNFYSENKNSMKRILVMYRYKVVSKKVNPVQRKSRSRAVKGYNIYIV